MSARPLALFGALLLLSNLVAAAEKKVCRTGLVPITLPSRAAKILGNKIADPVLDQSGRITALQFKDLDGHPLRLLPLTHTAAALSLRSRSYGGEAGFLFPFFRSANKVFPRECG